MKEGRGVSEENPGEFKGLYGAKGGLKRKEPVHINLGKRVIKCVKHKNCKMIYLSFRKPLAPFTNF